MDCNLCREDVLYGIVGFGWWYGFLHRNGHQIVAIGQLDWTTTDNISQVYNIIYDKMVYAGVSEKLDILSVQMKKEKLLRIFINLKGKRIQNLFT